jgi:3-hydroxyisobutyrate dehydrogenase-like beta-hydroxyacid dehydrogenase
MNTKPSLGFIGLGLMGVPMVTRLINAGFHVTVWNRDTSKLSDVVTLGASAAYSIADLVHTSEIIMLCVSDTQAVESVVFAQDAIADNARPDQIVVDFSSIDPQATRQFAKRLSEQSGTQWVDAPVSGGVAGAESGDLVVLAGGDETVVDRLRPVLDYLSQRITFMGPVGSGQTTKVCNQMLVGCNVLVMAEVLALAEKAGVDSSKIPAALRGGFADSIPLQLTGPRMANRDFTEVKWHVKTLLKDLDMSQSLVEALHADTPMVRLAQQVMRQHSQQGYAEKDPCTLIEAYTK